MITPERVYQIALTREQAVLVQRWAVRNIHAFKGFVGGPNASERERIAKYQAINVAIAEQLRAQDAGEGE